MLIRECWERGSSPRVRGKLAGNIRAEASRRLIPARAGKTRLMRFQELRRRAHPRACGENGGTTLHMLRHRGSSPRVRGKRCGGRSWSRCIGLIPARAGKTAAMRLAFSETGAHPRACGENSTAALYRTAASGSSPRVRGKRPKAPDRDARRGLIPARAGKTRRRSRRAAGSRAHPRACGENVKRAMSSPMTGGSSPRVRGKHADDALVGRMRGLIPARAGKTAWRWT